MYRKRILYGHSKCNFKTAKENENCKYLLALEVYFVGQGHPGEFVVCCIYEIFFRVVYVEYISHNFSFTRFEQREICCKDINLYVRLIQCPKEIMQV